MLKVGALSFSVKTIFLRITGITFYITCPLLNEMNPLPLVMSSVLVVNDNFVH